MEWIDFELGVSEGLRVRVVVRLVLEGINHYLPDLLKYITMPCIDQFQNSFQSCFTDSELSPPGFFQNSFQSCFTDSELSSLGFFQYSAQYCCIEPLIKEDAHPLKPKTILKAINESFFIWPFFLSAFQAH